MRRESYLASIGLGAPDVNLVSVGRESAFGMTRYEICLPTQKRRLILELEACVRGRS